MNLSLRLKCICDMVDKCNLVADIGTDHGYIPIYLVKNHKCMKAIASDINEGPIQKARLNVSMEGLQQKVECRLGSGLNTIYKGEAQGIIIAGMGGNLIRDIIDENIDVFKSAEFCILQPVQNPEVVRKYIYQNGFKIIDENLCIDENIFYEIIKVKYSDIAEEKEDIFYEVGEKLIQKKHPLALKFIESKINKYKNILGCIKDDSNLAKMRKLEIENKIIRLQELVKCL